VAFAANLLIFGFLGFCGWLNSTHPSAYHAAMQEDQALEWASFWSFFLAAAVFALAARRQRRESGAFPWFLAGVSLFCVFVAMEEISWGQRVFGLTPAEYFLAENYQQEINLHNIAGTDARLWVFRGIILGYGVLLPMLARIPWTERALRRLAIVAPPLWLTPALLALFLVHLSYPWKFTGEVIECGLGFAFLIIAMANAAELEPTRRPATVLRASALPVLAVVLGFATAAWSQNRRSADPAMLERAEMETAALRDDLLSAAKAHRKKAITRCGTHKRLYTFVEEYEDADPLRRGSFAGLAGPAMPEERAEFFLDPWSSPYWVRDRCKKKEGQRVIFVYSFGPNRSRDSTRWEIRGDDIGHYVLREPSE
jgi:hypothetical protein